MNALWEVKGKTKEELKKHYKNGWKGTFKKGHKIPEWQRQKMLGRLPFNKGIERPEIQGPNHHNWKGGTTGLRAAIRTTTKYKKWRAEVFKRDKYTCQKCGKRGRRLQVHHIKPFYKIMEDNKLKTVEQAKKCKELWDMENGTTLCIPCHKQTDSYLVNQYTLK